MSRPPLPRPSPFSWDRWEPVFRLAVMAVGALILGWSLHSGRLFPGLWGNAGIRPGGVFLRVLLGTTTAIFLVSIVWRTIFWFRYRQADASRVVEWPASARLFPEASRQANRAVRTVVRELNGSCATGVKRSGCR